MKVRPTHLSSRTRLPPSHTSLPPVLSLLLLQNVSLAHRVITPFTSAEMSDALSWFAAVGLRLRHPVDADTPKSSMPAFTFGSIVGTIPNAFHWFYDEAPDSPRPEAWTVLAQHWCAWVTWFNERCLFTRGGAPVYTPEQLSRDWRQASSDSKEQLRKLAAKASITAIPAASSRPPRSKPALPKKDKFGSTFTCDFCGEKGHTGDVVYCRWMKAKAMPKVADSPHWPLYFQWVEEAKAEAARKKSA